MANATEEVTAATAKLCHLMVNMDAAALGALVADDVSYGHSNARVHDRAPLLKDMTDGTSVFKTFDVSGQTVIAHGDTGIARHVVKARTFNSGVDGEVHISILLIWQKRGGEWKLVARQAVKVP